MTDPIRPRLFLGVQTIVLIVAAVVFLLGIQWGLPTKAVDQYLFGNETPWPGSKIVALAPADSDERGADVDADPLSRARGVEVLNSTDADRAEIIRRYRLFSHQPDEMITFKSLSRIRQNNGDPRLYQYGGLWIYPVGALLKVSSMFGIVDLRGGPEGQAYYLDHPEAFGRFYLVARFYVAIWGLVGAWAIFWILRRMNGGQLVPALGAICFALMPVVLNLAHEAKPHLPAAAMILLAVLAGTKFVDTGKIKWALFCGALCGAAAGTVLWAGCAISMLLMLIFLRPGGFRSRATILVQCVSAALAVYIVTNPFVLINLIRKPALLQSNLSNTTAMYPISLGGLRNALWLAVEGTSPLLLTVGVAGAAFLLASNLVGRVSRMVRADACPGRADAGWLLLPPTLIIGVVFIVFGSHKPPEYARFALLLDIGLLIAAFGAIGCVRKPAPRAVMAIVLVSFTALSAFPYIRGFIRDCAPITSRLAAAHELKRLIDRGASSARTVTEPAPYCFPPIDLLRCKLALAAPGADASADIIVRLDIARSPNPISWADAHFAIISPRERVRELQRKAATIPTTTIPTSGPTTVSSPP